MRRTLLVGAVVLIQAACARQATLGTNANVAAGGTGVEVPSLDAIRADDLKRDLFALAGDAMRGREAGTLDELRASGWLVEQVRAIGLEPAGEDGTYYQWWPMRRIRQSDASVVRVGGESLKLWRDVVVASAVDANVDPPDRLRGDARRMRSWRG
jgi:hypothetical protein